MLNRILVCGALVASLALAGACGSKGKGGETTPGGGGGAAGEQKPLYERLGGLEGIAKVVDKFLEIVVADDRINARFQNADAARLREQLIAQLCEATGGGPIVGCAYEGKSMVEAHAGMNISEEEFNALAEDFQKAMQAVGVPEAEQAEVMGALGGMKGDIVGK